MARNALGAAVKANKNKLDQAATTITNSARGHAVTAISKERNLMNRWPGLTPTETDECEEYLRKIVQKGLCKIKL